jgi:hypothetical protein
MAKPTFKKPAPTLVEVEEKETTVVEEVKIEVKKEAPKASGFSGVEKRVVTWKIDPDPESEGIIATNKITRKVFKGTQKEFTNNLRG